MSKLAKATEIVKASQSKSEALDKIVAELSVTRANAFVYFTKASKALGSVLPKGDKPAKAEATGKTNPVTGLTAAKRKEKVAEIERVVADLKVKAAQQTPEQRATAFWQQTAGVK